MTSRHPGEALSPRGWVIRIAPPALLVVLAIAGLRSALQTPRWNGPLHRSGVAIGWVLLAVLVTLLVLTWIRHRAAARDVPDAAPGAGTAAKLRVVMMSVLSGGIAATVVATLYALHLHLSQGKPPASKAHSQRPPTPAPPPPTTRASQGFFSIPVGDILYALLVLALIAAVVLSVRWSSRLRPPVRLGDELDDESDPEQLREAVESGRSAMRALDDARAAIIACYLAMERSLAERGEARSAADTPDELLARAIRSKIVRGAAAARLTTLFYEARFSSHPMDRAKREAAERALDELAAALAARSDVAEADA